MKFITITGIDKAGKTTIIDEYMRQTNYRNYVVDRDPSTYHALNVIQNRIKSKEQIAKYQKFMDKFINFVDLSVLLICESKTLKERFAKTNEPKLVGGFSIEDHQEVIIESFYSFDYKNFMIIDTTNETVKECVQLIIDKLGE